MSRVAVSAIASDLFSASELSPAARRLGADLLGSAAGCCGVVTEGIEDLAGRVSVSWNRARVLLGELSRAGFITYWSYQAAGRRWVCVSWLAWVVGVPRVAPPAQAAEDFGQDAPISGDLTQNVLGDEAAGGDRSAEIADPVVVVVVVNKQTNKQDQDLEQTTTARAHTCEGAGADSGSGDPGLTQNVLSEADRIVALLTDPEIGLGRGMARRCASRGDFWAVVGNVFEWRRQRDAGSLRSPHAALSHRLLAGWDGVILEADRHSDLWRRHCWPALAAEEGAELTQNVLGDELAELQPAEAPAVDLTQNVLGDGPADPGAAGDWWGEFVAEEKRGCSGLATWIEGTAAEIEGDRVVLRVPAHRVDWLRAKGAGQIRRRLAVILHRQISAVDVLGVAA